jgi:hypothetical protein
MSAGRNKGSGLTWFIRRGSTVRGPFSSTRVRHFVLEGKLDLDDEVSRDRNAWQRLGSVDEVVPLQLRDQGHDLVVGTADGASGGRGAVRAIIVVSVIIIVLTLAVYFAGRPVPEAARDCAADPAPGGFLEGCRLSGKDISGANLGGARLANADLGMARLSGADLSQADARYADLGGADLSYARLQAAVLKGANLRLADLTNADLRGADLSFADLGGARVGGAQFGDANLQGAIWVDGRPCGVDDCPR